MSTPTGELSNALAWLELYAHARFVKKCLPSAKYMARIEGVFGENCYEVRSEEKSLFRFRSGRDFFDENDVFFSLDLQGIIEEIKKQGRHLFYERTLKEAMSIHVKRLNLKDWETFETLYFCCKSLIPIVEEAPNESEPLDIDCFGHRELSGIEASADRMIRKMFVAPFPEIGEIDAWKSRILRGAKA